MNHHHHLFDSILERILFHFSYQLPGSLSPERVKKT